MEISKVVSAITTVALIAAATRWLATYKGRSVPESRCGTVLYALKTPWRVVGFGGFACFGIAAPAAVLTGQRSWFAACIFGLMSLGALFLTAGSVSTDEMGVTKHGLFKRRSVAWSEIQAVCRHQKDVGAIELRSGSGRLVIDGRIVAFEHFIEQVERRTGRRATNVGKPS